MQGFTSFNPSCGPQDHLESAVFSPSYQMASNVSRNDARRHGSVEQGQSVDGIDRDKAVDDVIPVGPLEGRIHD